MQAIALEEAETRIRETVKNEFFKQAPAATIGKKVDKIIFEALKDVKIPALRDAALRSLRNFARRQYNELKRSFGTNMTVLLALLKLTDTGASDAVKQASRRTLVNQGYDAANLYGTALKKFSEDYMRKNVRPALDRLAKQFTLDPDDVSRRNSLRNRAEMEVRYQGHLDNLAELRAGGNNLVIISTHADCSKRCRPWQGRVYSLDRTSGITNDGRSYVPIEVATDVWYVSPRTRKRYPNGLFSYNCRHYAVPYRSGYRFPKPNPAEEARQYAITQKQRELERNVRYWRTKAITDKNVDRASYLNARKKAIEWNNEYIRYSQEHRRAYYPSRTKII